LTNRIAVVGDFLPQTGWTKEAQLVVWAEVHRRRQANDPMLDIDIVAFCQTWPLDDRKFGGNQQTDYWKSAMDIVFPNAGFLVVFAFQKYAHPPHPGLTSHPGYISTEYYYGPFHQDAHHLVEFINSLSPTITRWQSQWQISCPHCQVRVLLNRTKFCAYHWHRAYPTTSFDCPCPHCGQSLSII
jgi:hypothetical protein